MQNNDRHFTKAFQHPQNGYYYVSLTFTAFSELMFSWIGAIAHCCMHYTDSSENPLKP